MKKILLATTALVGFAGAAAAEVALSGYAEIGVVGGNAVDAANGGGTQFWNDLNVTITMTGETDSGLTFGTALNLEDLAGDLANAPNTGDGINPSVDNDTNVWVSGSFGKVTLGDTDGALDWAASEIYMGTSLADDHSTHAGAYWNTGMDGTYDNQVMRYEYSFGDFAAAFSAELDDTGTGDVVLGLGVKWSGDMGGTAVSAGLGYQTANSADVVALSLGATMTNGFSANLGFATGNIFGSATDMDWMGLGLGYTTGALTVQANYGAFDSGVVGASDPSGWGLVANYDLGGGAVAMFGYGDSSNGTSSNGHGDQTWSAGLGLSF